MSDRTRDLLDDLSELVEAMARRSPKWPWPAVRPVEDATWECLAGDGVVILRGAPGGSGAPIEIRLKPDEAASLGKKLARMAKAAGEP